jgi:phosphatidylglycerophosphate synthase
VPIRLARSAANAVSASRLVLTPPFLWAVLHAHRGGSGWVAAGLFAAVATSDFADGRLARRFGAASAAGRTLDHAADITFILTSLALYVWLGVAPWWVPASIAAAFAVYVADSLRRSAPRPVLIGTRIGHLGGICNYVLIGVLTGNNTLGLEWLPASALEALFLLVPFYSAAAIAARALPVWRSARFGLRS